MAAPGLAGRATAPRADSAATSALSETPGIADARRRLLWHGMLVTVAALASGMFIASYTTPRLGLAAHVGGIMNGTLVAVIGLLWPDLRLGASAARAAFWSTVVSGYMNFGGLLLAAVFGTSLTTPMLGAGHTGAPWQEGAVGFLLVAGGVLSLVSCALVLYGVKRR